MAVNSEVPYVDVRTIRVRDLDLDEVKKAGGSALTDLGSTTTQTILATAILGGFITYSGATTTHTLPTAALLVAALPAAKVGERVECFISNTGAGTVTIGNPTGGTAGVGATGITIVTTVGKKLTILITNVATPAYTWFLA
jgi:hypothetical protein